MELVLVRGLPGSGKSTYAKELVRNNPSFVHLEADQFFVSPFSAKYVFKGELIKYAHQLCVANTVFSLSHNRSVVVSNTFIKLWEMEEYFKIEELLHPSFKIVEMETMYESVHSLPNHKIRTMKSKWEEIPEEWGIPIEVIR